MELKDQSDHVALLSLMLVGVLTKWLTETGQLDDDTAGQIHRLVQGVRIHARHAGLEDLDVLFDNVGNAMVDTVIPLLRPGGRIVISGQLADYNAGATVPGITNTRYFIASRLRMEGLVVFDDLKAFPAAQEELGGMIERGEIKVREHRYSGLESVPQAFIDKVQAA